MSGVLLASHKQKVGAICLLLNYITELNMLIESYWLISIINHIEALHLSNNRNKSSFFDQTNIF